MARPSRPNRDQRRLAQAVQQSFQLTASRLTVEQTSGPLPPPEILNRYEEIQPGFADRIVKMAEAEATHRRNLETRIIETQSRDIRDARIEARLGQIFAALIAVVGFGCGTYATVNGHPVAGGVLQGGTLVSLVLAFIWGRTQKPEQQQQQPTTPAPQDKQTEAAPKPQVEQK